MYLLTVGAEEFFEPLSREHSVHQAEDEDDALSLLSLDYKFEATIARCYAVAKDFPAKVRRRNQDALIMLTSQDRFGMVAGLLDQGADACLKVPLFFDDLNAHLRACVRRSKGRAENMVTLGALTLDRQTMEVQCHGTFVHFTEAEYKVLETILIFKMVKKDELYDILYLLEKDGAHPKILDVLICRIRKKLEPFGVNPIETIWGVGWRVKQQEGDTP